MSRLRVGFLSPRLKLAGAERWMIQLAQHCDPDVIEWVGTALCEWSTEDQVMVDEMRRYMPVYGPPSHGRSDRAERVIRSSKDAADGIAQVLNRADVVLTWDAHKLWVMASTWVNRGLKVVLVSHSDGPANANVGMEDGATHFAAVSKPALNVFSPEAQAKATIIYNGADPERCCPVRGRKFMRESMGYGDNDKIIGYIGRLSEEKNPLASAWALRNLPDNYHAIFVGPDQMGDFHEKVGKIISPSRFRVMPPVNQIGDYLAMFDCLMVASGTEAFSLRIIEGWLAGVPVISTPIGAIPELENLHGVMTLDVAYRERFNGESLAKAVVKAVNSHPGWLEVVRRIAWDNYTAPACAQRWTDYLVKLGERA